MAIAYEMSDEDKREIVAEFLSESDQHIQTLNTLLLKAEQVIKAGQELSADQINTMFRSAHTIKGSASMLGFDNLSHLTHEMETLLDRVRNKKMSLTLTVIEVLFTAFDALTGILDKLRNEGIDTLDVNEVIEKIKAVLVSNGAPVDAVAASAAVIPPEKALPSAAATPVADVPQTLAEKKQDAADMSKYLPAFIDDGNGCVLRFNEILMAIEKGQFNPDQSNELFRLAHTIKGSSGIVKCKGIEAVAHHMENLLSDLRNKGIKPSAEMVALLFKGIDWIRAALDGLQKNNYQEGDLPGFLKQFSEGTISPLPAAEAPAATADPFVHLSEDLEEKVSNALSLKDNVYKIVIRIQKKALKGLKGVIVDGRLRKTGKVLASVPKLDAVPDSSSEVSVHVLYATANHEDQVRALLSVDEVDIMSLNKDEFSHLQQPAVPVPPPQPASAPVAAAPVPVSASVATAPAIAPAAGKTTPVEITTMKVDSHKLDNLMNLAGELVITRARFAQLVSEFNMEVHKLRDASSRLGQFASDLEVIQTFVRKSSRVIELEKVSKTLTQMQSNLVSVQAVMSSKEVGTKAYGLDEATSIRGKLSSDIQTAVMQTRMVPIEGVFSRFRRLVRDIGKDLGKDVNLELYGEDTELDKKIIDCLPDSLTHMIRNAIDHGIESKQERIAAGKKEIGTIQLKAVHQGNSICIEIIDDGKGLDAEKIARKAYEKGLVTEEKLLKLDEKDKLDFIFLPGFSTAEKVTGLSGRGVGMDVVKKMIESLNGTVDIETELGKGSRFVLKIPLTLAIIQALLVVINKQVFAIPLESVSEIIKIASKDVYSVDGLPMIKLRGHALSLLSMAKILGIEDVDQKIEGDRKIVVITSNNQLSGIKVDKLIGEDEIVIKAFPDYFANVKGVSGASILGDGNIALILDVSAIMREA
jgi:two-component system chemotaxis sensor kinase CheA